MSATPVYTMEPGIDEQIIGGEKDIAVAGTAEPLTADTPRILEVQIQAKRTNTGRVYYGGSSVQNNDTNGNYLEAGERVTISVTNLNKIYLDVSVSSEGVTYVATKE